MRSVRAAPVISNNTYFGGNKGGCFDESCYVMVQNSGKTKVSNVRKNDTVQVVDTTNGYVTTARVRHVVRIDRGGSGAENLVKFKSSGLALTKKHPVWINGKWQSPIHLVDNVNVVPYQSTSNYVYNFILDHPRMGLLVNGIPCVTFGHGIQEIWHRFYASSDIIRVIESLSDNGFVTISSNTLIQQYA